MLVFVEHPWRSDVRVGFYSNVMLLNGKVREINSASPEWLVLYGYDGVITTVISACKRKLPMAKLKVKKSTDFLWENSVICR